LFAPIRNRNPEIVADRRPIGGDGLAIGGQVIIVSIAGKGVAEKLFDVGARPRLNQSSLV